MFPASALGICSSCKSASVTKQVTQSQEGGRQSSVSTETAAVNITIRRREVLHYTIFYKQHGSQSMQSDLTRAVFNCPWPLILIIGQKIGHMQWLLYVEKSGEWR